MRKQIFQDPEIESSSVEVLSKRLIAITKELTIANQELSRVQEEQRNLFSNISHDLRAPISAIRSAVDLLSSGQVLSQEEQDLAIKLIDRRTLTLERMIHDLYLLFTLDNKELPLHLETIQAAPFFEEYFFNALMDQRYENKNMQLELAQDLDLSITIDIQLMIRVLDNLFSNAAKYSVNQAKICLSVTASQDATQLILQVTDTGIGIPADSLSKIFDRTYTVSTSRTPESATGSGLGLSIVKTIIERLNGSIRCESQVSQGTTFTILLPTSKK